MGVISINVIITGRVGASLCSMTDLVRTCVVAHPSSLVQNDANLIIKPMFFELASNDTGIDPLVPYPIKERNDVLTSNEFDDAQIFQFYSSAKGNQGIF